MRRPKRFLYRYYANIDFVLDVLRHRRLYHCCPSEFNDPFDCRPLISIRHSPPGDDATWWKLLYYLAKVEYARATKEDLEKHADAAFANGRHRDPQWLTDVDNALRQIGALVRVCCFANEPRNMMMWEHYAGNHQGLALAFRSSFLHDAESNEYRGQDVTYPPRVIGVTEYVEALRRGLDEGDVVAMARIYESGVGPR